MVQSYGFSPGFGAFLSVKYFLRYNINPTMTITITKITREIIYPIACLNLLEAGLNHRSFISSSTGDLLLTPANVGLMT